MSGLSTAVLQHDVCKPSKLLSHKTLTPAVARRCRQRSARSGWAAGSSCCPPPPPPQLCSAHLQNPGVAGKGLPEVAGQLYHVHGPSGACTPAPALTFLTPRDIGNWSVATDMSVLQSLKRLVSCGSMLTTIAGTPKTSPDAGAPAPETSGLSLVDKSVTQTTCQREMDGQPLFAVQHCAQIHRSDPRICHIHEPRLVPGILAVGMPTPIPGFCVPDLEPGQPGLPVPAVLGCASVAAAQRRDDLGALSHTCNDACLTRKLVGLHWPLHMARAAKCYHEDHKAGMRLRSAGSGCATARSSARARTRATA